MGPPPRQPARRGLIWPRAANGQRPPHFKGRAAQSAEPPSAAAAALFMPGAIFSPRRPTLGAPCGSSSGMTFPPTPLPAPSPPNFDSPSGRVWARPRWPSRVWARAAPLLGRSAASWSDGGSRVASRGLGGRWGGGGREDELPRH